MSKCVIVVPCYNEEKRLDRERIVELVQGPDDYLLFVNDGSTDGTQAVIEQLSRDDQRISAMTLARNSGKAEAVRAGLQQALDQGADIVGYYDSDLATPPREMLAMMKAMRESDFKVLLGSRVRLLGRHVDRMPFRHYLGRGFATVASLALKLSVYDTQCGAKLLRRTEALEYAVSKPFTSRWAFDVELLSRLLNAPKPLHETDFCEYPLEAWEDVPGSKLSLSGMIVAGLDLGRIALSRRR